MFAGRRAALACAALVLILPIGLAPATAHAGETDEELEARRWYDRGAAAYDAGNWAVAATQFAHADELVPNLTVLRLALTASVRADDPVVGMSLVDRAKKRLGEGSPL